MPPKPRQALPAPGRTSASRDLISLKSPATRKDKTAQEKPTTERALILRHGKYGAMGTGEIARMGKMSGREKLELLAEDKLKSTIRAPFDLEKALKIARARLDVYVDDISSLQDPLFCYELMEREFRAHVPPKLAPHEADPMRSPTWLAEHFGARVHNTYMLASVWNVILQSLKEMDKMGLNSAEIVAQLQRSDQLRTIYSVVYNMAETLVDAGQQRLSDVAQNTPHYAPFFKSDNTNPQAPRVQFDWSELRTVYKSFVDSIVIEMCLPRSPFPLQVLVSCLHDRATESPEDLKRFPQAMWDAVGDLSDAVQMFELLESSFLTPAGRVLKPAQSIILTEWEKAQNISLAASHTVSNYKDLLIPLTNLNSKPKLSSIWASIQANYTRQCGKDLDTLWQLTAARKRIPHWKTYILPTGALDPIFESDSDDAPPLVPATGRRLLAPTARGKPNARRAITAAADVDDDELPALVDASSSSSAFDSDSAVDSDSDDEDGGESVRESDYNTDEEDELRDWLREAMDAYVENPDQFDVLPEAGDEYAEERKKNPFLKLLGSLRGRMFSPNPAIKTTKGSAPPRQAATGAALKTAPPSATGDGQDKTHKTTVQDVGDGEDAVKKDKKKKKKKPKKKKPAAAPSDTAQAPPPAAEAQRPEKPTPAAEPQRPLTSSPPASPPLQPLVSTTSKAPKDPPKLPPIRSPSKAPSTSASYTASIPFASAVSLALTQEETAQSARSYLQSTGMNESKSKLKSRPDYVAVPPPEKKKGIFSKLTSKSKHKEKNEKGGFMGRLSKKSANYVLRLIGTSPSDRKGSLKWDQFLQVMRDMGFEYDPSTAGSSVRFDPPDPRDPSITIHKPHPDPTLHPWKLREIGRRLRETYGWTEEKLVSGFGGFAGSNSDDDK